jgi:Ran GTPase-activating protein (RanGAP) involved in mRNA processing and transport
MSETLIDLSNSRAGDETVALLFTTMSNTGCVEIDLSGCDITEKGAKIIAKALKEGAYPSLRVLRLEENNIGNGVEDIADALKGNKTLTTLSLAHNELGDENVKVLANALKHNTSLNTLDVTNTDFGDESAFALTSMLHVNESLKTLHIDHNEHVSLLQVHHLVKAMALTGRDLSSPLYDFDLSAYVPLFFKA